MRRALRRGADRRRSAVHGDRGAAAVEFALVVPVLFILVFAVVNFGQILSARQAVSQAAAEGARAAAVTPVGEDPVTRGEAAIDQALEGFGGCGDGADCDVTIGVCAGDPGVQCASAEVVLDFEPLISGFTFGLPDTLHYTAVAEVN